MGGEPFQWPVGVYLATDEYNHIMMAMETTLNKEGVTYKEVKGTAQEHESLNNSYKHLCALRDELIHSGVIPALADWSKINPNLG